MGSRNWDIADHGVPAPTRLVLRESPACAPTSPRFQEPFNLRQRRTRDLQENQAEPDPFILRYKDDPRFAAFCRKVGLPVHGEASRKSA